MEDSMGRWLRAFKFPSVERGTELYYVKKDTGRLAGITAGFEL